jgi:hypothetical protein
MAEAEKEPPMGVSDRSTHAIEPKAGDLLMPERRLKAHRPRMRDVEDARFETLGGNRVKPVHIGSGPNSRPVFKSRLAAFPADGPYPRDFAPAEHTGPSGSAVGERLGVFGGGAVERHSAHHAPAATAFALGVCAIAAAAFWMAGGHALVVTPPTELQASVPGVPALAEASASIETGLDPDPVITSSIPSAQATSGASSIVHPKPRPARIERAGSILMIRPDGG